MPNDPLQNQPPSLRPGASTPISSSTTSAPAVGSTPVLQPNGVDGNPLLVEQNENNAVEKKKKQAEEAAEERNRNEKNAKKKIVDNSDGGLVLQHLVEQAQKIVDKNKEENELYSVDGSKESVVKNIQKGKEAIETGWGKMKDLFGKKNANPDPADDSGLDPASNPVANLSPASDGVSASSDLKSGIPNTTPKIDSNAPSASPPTPDATAGADVTADASSVLKSTL